jgi:hypothetical protein
MQVEAKAKVDAIRVLNDRFRQSFMGGKVMRSHAFAELPIALQTKVMCAIQQFVDFDEDNDPHGEHDFVSVDIDGEKYFGKIDYYAPDMEHGCEDPSDPKQTVRVLTIMHSSDY